MLPETIKTILTLVSGFCWTLVYIEGIRLGIKDRSYAIPFYALALNLAWELLHAYLGLLWNNRRPLRPELFYSGSRDALLSFRSDLYLDVCSIQASESHLNRTEKTRGALQAIFALVMSTLRPC
jgi:hypothetical protein